MITSTAEKLKTLDKLVADASKALTSLGGENRKLQDAIRRLEAENKQLKESLRAAQTDRSRNEKLKARLEKIASKLDKIG